MQNKESSKSPNSIDSSPHKARILYKPLVLKTKPNAMEEKNHLTVAIIPLDSVIKVHMENLQEPYVLTLANNSLKLHKTD